MTLKIRPWSEEEFAAGRQPWQKLLLDSDADPLFMGWDWQYTWWRHHGHALGGELQVLAIENAADELVGLAPFYLRPVKTLRLLTSRRLEGIGNAWRNPNAAFSEYFDLILPHDEHEHALAVLQKHLCDKLNWQELVVSCTHPEAAVLRLASGLGNRAFERQVESLPSFVIDLQQGFENFARVLSSGVRRRLLNQRSKLPALRLRVVSPTEVPIALDLLHKWRNLRWQTVVSGPLLAFERELAERLAAQGQLWLSLLEVSGSPISALYDIRVGDTEYYIASAFSPDAESGQSPGYLHLGFAIEAACAAGVQRYDLLAGRGLNRDYKRDLATRDVVLTSRHIIRAPLLRGLHRLHARLKRTS